MRAPKSGVRRGRIIGVSLGLLLAVCIALSLRLGSVWMDTQSFWGGLLSLPGFETPRVILYSLRLPRLIAALLAGIGLSLSGVLLQRVTNNDLASPNIIGVNAGAGFSVMLCLCFAPRAVSALPFAAFAGAFGTTLLILTLSRHLGASKTALVLCGVACTTVFQAGISFLTLLDTDALVSYSAFSMGGLSGVTLRQLAIPAVLIVLCLLMSRIFAGKINTLCLGDELASCVGIHVRTMRLICLILASASAASVVSYAGLLGFVGLMAPHITRALVGGDVRRQLRAAPAVGAILVIVSDLIGRTILAPTEIPVGVLMALLGAPFFFFLLYQGRRTHANL